MLCNVFKKTPLKDFKVSWIIAIKINQEEEFKAAKIIISEDIEMAVILTKYAVAWDIIAL